MTHTANPPTAANLRSLKESKGLTVSDIARAVNVGERVVQYWLQDEGNIPSWPNICKLADLFNVRPAYFYDDQEAANHG